MILLIFTILTATNLRKYHKVNFFQS